MSKNTTHLRSPKVIKLDRALSGGMGRQILIYLLIVVATFLVLFGIACLSGIDLTSKLEDEKFSKFWKVLFFFYDGGLEGTIPKNHWFAYLTNILGSILMGGILIATITNYLLSNRDKAEKGLLRYRVSGHSVFIGYHDSMLPLVRKKILGHTYAVVLSELPFSEAKDKVIAGLKADYLNKQVGLKAQIYNLEEQIKKIKEKQQKNEASDEDIKKREKSEMELPYLKQELAKSEIEFNNLEQAIEPWLIVYHGLRTEFDDLKSLCLDKAKEVFIFPEPLFPDTDSTNLDVVKQISNLRNSKGERLKCTAIFQHNAVVACFERNDIDEQVKTSLDFKPVIYGDAVVLEMFSRKKDKKRVFVLDREPITDDSNKSVHLFIMGLGEIGQSLFTRAARQLHFPNFRKAKSRITLVGERGEINTLKASYREFFAVADKDEKYAYLGDFLDISFDAIPRDSVEERDAAIKTAISNSDELVTIAVCLEDSSEALRRAISLPREVYDNKIPVWVYKPDSDSLMSLIGHESLYKNISLFGEFGKVFDIDASIETAAIRLNGIYDDNYKKFKNEGTQNVISNGLIPDDPSDDAWRKKWETLSIRKKWSNLNYAYFIPVIFRSLDLKEEEADKLREIPLDTFYLVEHNRWVADTLLGGLRPPLLDERKEMEEHRELKDVKKSQLIHLDLCSFDKLLPAYVEGVLVDVRVFDKMNIESIPLLLKQ